MRVSLSEPNVTLASGRLPLGTLTMCLLKIDCDKGDPEAL